MGMNSTVLILNDQLHDIAADPQTFVDCLLGACNGGTPIEWTTGKLVACHHADDTAIIAVSGNQAKVLGYAGPRLDDIEALKQVANQLGYELKSGEVNPPPKKCNDPLPHSTITNDHQIELTPHRTLRCQPHLPTPQPLQAP